MIFDTTATQKTGFFSSFFNQVKWGITALSFITPIVQIASSFFQRESSSPAQENGSTQKEKERTIHFMKAENIPLKGKEEGPAAADFGSTAAKAFSFAKQALYLPVSVLGLSGLLGVGIFYLSRRLWNEAKSLSPPPHASQINIQIYVNGAGPVQPKVQEVSTENIAVNVQNPSDEKIKREN